MFNKIYLSALFAALALHSMSALAQNKDEANRLNSTAFNPAMSLILGGVVGSLQQDPAIPATGFAMNSNPGHPQGFNLGESELVLTANIDTQFHGVGRFAIDPAGGLSAEEVHVQTSALGKGTNLKMGRFLSGLGYLNEKHAHTWDFVDQPLVYATLWDNQLRDDGVQLKWLAPADMFVELAVELGRGSGFPGTDRVKNGNGATALWAHIGDDIGLEHSWRAGVSLHQTRRVNAASEAVPDVNGNGVNNIFTGKSQTAGMDFVWKYAPNGNLHERYIKLQGEFFRRKENGLLTYDTPLNNITDNYSVTQRGWYVQSIYQFVPRWRAGLRYDQLDSGSAQVGVLHAPNIIRDYGYTPKRNTLMLDYSPSEFSRLRVQWAQDKSRQGLPDQQLFVQYSMSMGAHGAHAY